MTQKNTVEESVIYLIKQEKISFTLIQHQPVYTMEQAALACGHKPEEGVKTLMIRTYKTKSQYDFALVVWRGDRRVDWNQIATELNVKKVSMAGEDEVEQALGIKIGALTPFGYEKKLPVIFDNSLLENANAYINPGRHDETLTMSSKDLLVVIKAWVRETESVAVIASNPE